MLSSVLDSKAGYIEWTRLSIVRGAAQPVAFVIRISTLRVSPEFGPIYPESPYAQGPVQRG
ncbi:protein of unknown function (plasmid) [Pararobbsia alpina]